MERIRVLISIVFLFLSTKSLSTCFTARGRCTALFYKVMVGFGLYVLPLLLWKLCLTSGQRLLKLQYSSLTNQESCLLAWLWVGDGWRKGAHKLSSPFLGISPLKCKAEGDKECLSLCLRCQIPWPRAERRQRLVFLVPHSRVELSEREEEQIWLKAQRLVLFLWHYIGFLE